MGRIGRTFPFGGQMVWVICFALLLVSTPALVRDLLDIQSATEQATGVDYWYEGQLNRELLRLQVTLTQAVNDPEVSPETINFRLDMVFSRINNMPRPGSGWNTLHLTELQEPSRIREYMNEIDAALPMLEQDRQRFLDLALLRTEEALAEAQRLSFEVVARQNAMAGTLQKLFIEFRYKLLLYGAGFIALVTGLGYLMVSHIRAEHALRKATTRLVDIAELERARDEAVRANRVKDSFMANVSHELRTPLNAIIGFSEMLREPYCGPLNDKQREYVEDIHSAGQRLLALINDLLDLSRLRAGKYELLETEIDLNRMVQSAIRDMREAIRKAGISVTVSVPKQPVVVRADARKLRQVIDNLLANSLKFTESGGSARIVVESPEDPSEGPRIVVADTGIGIAPEDIPRVFRPFEQVDGALARKHQGTGLGLPLVKAFVDLHGGTVDMASVLGEGTTVTVTLPPERLMPGLSPGDDRKDVPPLPARRVDEG